MGRFDFVSDNGMRASLESDYTELQKAISNEMWKSVHVMSGSIVEALLVANLQAEGYNPKNPKHTILDIMLAEAIEAAFSLGIIADRSLQLSTVIRQYRNLIHPGKIIREGEKVDKNTAIVAQALVEIIAGEVENFKKTEEKISGYQVLSKTISDSNIFVMIDKLIDHVDKEERYKILWNLIPQALREENIQHETEINLIRLYNYVHSVIDEQTCIELGKNIERMIKTDEGEGITKYLHSLFNADNVRRYSHASSDAIYKYAINEFRQRAWIMYDKFGNIGDNCPDGILDTFASTLLDVAGRKALTEIQMSEMARSFDYLNKDVKMMEIFESQGRTKISSIESHASPGITPEESLKTIKFLVNMFVELRSLPF